MNVGELKKLLSKYENETKVYVNQTVGFGVYDEIYGAIRPHKMDACFDINGNVSNDGIILIPLNEDYMKKGRYAVDVNVENTYTEKAYAHKIILKVLEGSGFGDNKKLMRTLLIRYLNSISENKDIDYNRVCELCIKHLKKHNYL